jgi:hypothetical protein
VPIANPKAKELLKSKFEDDRSFGTVLLVILLDEFGTELFSWEPESIRMGISDQYGADVTQLNQDKIWSLITALTTNQFYVSLEIFMATCDSLSNDEHDFGLWTPNTPFELAWGVTEVLLSDPFDEEHPNSEFSNEIENYTGVVLSENGILEPPKMLAFAEYQSENPVLDLDTAFIGDPDMFEAAYAKQQADKVAIEVAVEERLSELLTEIGNLPLQNARKDFMQRLQGNRS